MNSNRLLSIGAVVLGVVFIGLAVMYLTVPPKSLPGPSLFGHENGVSALHIKHGIACFMLALACFVFAWFGLGPKRVAAGRA
jgi:hypothetical protein